MVYTKPILITYSEEALEELLQAYASPCTGGTYCQTGTQYSQACGSGSNYCSQAANYSGTGTTPQPCSKGSNYYGANSGTSNF